MDPTSENTQTNLEIAGRYARKVVFTIIATIALGAFLVMLAGLFIYQIGFRPLAEETDTVSLAPWGNVELPPPGDGLRVLSANLNYGAGTQDLALEQGEHRALDPEKVRGRLDRLAALVRDRDIDVLLLQDVDFGSRYAGELDQAEYLARRLSYGYLHRVRLWKHPYLPYPAPLQGRMLGPVDMGMAVVSRLPIVKAARYALPPVEREDWWQTTFAPHFALQEIIVTADGRRLQLFNLRLARDNPLNRERQARVAAELVGRESQGRALLAGTFQAGPPNRRAVKDGRRVDYTFDLLRHRRNFQPLFKDLEFLASPDPYATRRAAGGLEPADFILPEKGLTLSDWEILRLDAPFSSHDPILVEVGF